MADQPIRVLFVDDDPVQVCLVQGYLAAARAPAFTLATVGTLDAAVAHLATGDADVVLLDLSLPDSAGAATVFRVQECRPGLPVVVLTGTEDEALGEHVVQAGAQDYLVKSQLSAPILRRSLRYAVERGRLLGQLQRALASIKTLRGLISICYHCKRLRTAAGTWQHLEEYLQQHTEADLSHGLCEDCAYELHPKYFKDPKAAPGPPPGA